MRLYDIKKRYIDDSLRFYICEVYAQHRYSIGDESTTQKAQDMIRDVLGRQAGSLLEKEFIRDWKVSMKFSDKATRRDMKIDSLLLGIDEEVEEFIEVAYQMTDRSFHSVRVEKRHLDAYVPI